MTTAAKSQESSNRGNEQGRRQRPAWSKTSFPLTVAVFEFPNDNGSPNFSVKLTRAFRRDESSEWENTEYLGGGGDLLRAAKMLESADAFVQSRLQADYRARKEDGDGF
ncbi:hypothetical protein PLANPX_3915 [Lacipirellula parvula]|uniref:Uncharacterized protein n=2 Tax=Lacipirellula parvula TaxID=2650471 RepID=A0A5K7XJA6_9BACT|nr:hypothetical protein PLANPX_3915 [Lacipirellula parvula]